MPPRLGLAAGTGAAPARFGAAAGATAPSPPSF